MNRALSPHDEPPRPLPTLVAVAVWLWLCGCGCVAVPAMVHWCCSQGGGNDPAAPHPSRPARYVAAPTPCHTSSSMTTNLSAMAPGALSRHERHSAMVLAVSQLLQQARAEISDCKNKDVGSIATGATGSGELSQCTAILHHDLVRWHGLNGTGRCYDQARGMLSL